MGPRLFLVAGLAAMLAIFFTVTSCQTRHTSEEGVYTLSGRGSSYLGDTLLHRTIAVEELGNNTQMEVSEEDYRKTEGAFGKTFRLRVEKVKGEPKRAALLD